ncbi:MAG: histidine phosphotransferase family protein [Pseudomonadota bacterium]
MTTQFVLNDLDLAALISSRICHDIISPVGAISNGLEVLDEEDDEEVRAYAMDLIRKSTEQASAKLQFARLAFGAGGSAGTEIEIKTIKTVASGIVDPDKHRIIWQGNVTKMPKNRVKILLNLIAIAITVLPRGGDMTIVMQGDSTAPVFYIACEGVGGRVPEKVAMVFSGRAQEPLDTMSIQPFYACMLAETCSMKLNIEKKGSVVTIFAS